jgi:hypothetical protein
MKLESGVVQWVTESDWTTVRKKEKKKKCEGVRGRVTRVGGVDNRRLVTLLQPMTTWQIRWPPVCFLHSNQLTMKKFNVQVQLVRFETRIDMKTDIYGKISQIYLQANGVCTRPEALFSHTTALNSSESCLDRNHVADFAIQFHRITQ